MEEGVFPTCPAWFSSKIIANRSDGLLAYGSYNKLILLQQKGASLPEKKTIWLKPDSRITSVAFSPEQNQQSESYIAASCDDGFVRIWNADTLSPYKEHKSHFDSKSPSKVCCLDWSSFNPSTVCSVAENGSLVVLGILSGTATRNDYHKMLPNVLSCCPFKPLVAVGCKSGLVWIINFLKQQVIYKLRGHEFEVNSLSWCPNSVNIFEQRKVSEDLLLASAGKDKSVYIWKAGSDGHYEVQLELPQFPTSSDVTRSKPPRTIFMTVLWLDPYTLLQSSLFGELVKWDLKSLVASKQDRHDRKLKLAKFCSVVHTEHGRGLFAIIGKQYSGIRTEKVSQVENGDVNDINGEENIWEIEVPKCEKLVCSVSQDNTMVLFDVENEKVIRKLSTFSGPVLSFVFSPHDPNVIALGASDGKIRLWNLTDDNNFFRTYWQRVHDKVLCMAWNPNKEGMLAFGTGEGRIGLLDIGSGPSRPPLLLKSLHRHKVYSLCWGPPCWPDGESPFTSDTDLTLYSCGDGDVGQYNTNKAFIDPQNLSKFVQFPCPTQTDVRWKDDLTVVLVGHQDGSISVHRPPHLSLVTTVSVYKKYIQFITWHPQATTADTGISLYHNYFSASSGDQSNEIKVYKLENDQVTQVTTLTGHMSSIHYIAWNPHVSCQLVSTSRDNTVQVWDVLTQTPIVNFTVSSESFMHFSHWSPIDLDLIISGSQDCSLYVWRVSSQTRTTPVDNQTKRSKPNKKRKSGTTKQIDDVSVVSNEGSSASVATVPVSMDLDKNHSLLMKSAKNKSAQPLNNCYRLLSTAEDCVEDSLVDLNVGVKFLDNVDAFIQNEQEQHERVQEHTAECMLSLWKGNLKEVVEERIKSGKGLTDVIVALSTSVSPRLWKEACLAYSEQLAKNKYYTKSASYLLACHKVEEAVNVLTDGGLYKEALCVIKARVPNDDDLLKSVLQQYSAKLIQSGLFCHAAECFLYMGDYMSAAKNLARGKSEHHLRCAALAATKAGNENLCVEYVTEAFRKCLTNKNWEFAKGLYHDHPEYKHLLLQYTAYKILCRLDEETGTTSQDLLTLITTEADLDEDDLVRCYENLDHFYDKSAINRDKAKMFLTISNELSAAISTKDVNLKLTHIIRALNSCDLYFGEECILFKLCVWLSRTRDLLSDDNLFCYELEEYKSTDCKNKVRSLRAYLCKAVVEKQPSTMSSEEVLNILDAVVADALHIDNLLYFMNKIEFKKLEKEIASDVLKQKIVKKVSSVENNAENNEENNKNVEPENSSNIVSLENGNHVSLENGSAEVSPVVLDDTNVVDDSNTKESRLDELTTSINNFENDFVTVPHPVACYCKIKEICHNIKPNNGNNDKVDTVMLKTEELWKAGCIS